MKVIVVCALWKTDLCVVQTDEIIETHVWQDAMVSKLPMKVSVEMIVAIVVFVQQN